MSKEYWVPIVEEIEEKARQNILKKGTKIYDVSVTLPKNLRDRVAKIIPYEYDDYDRKVFIDKSQVDVPIKHDGVDIERKRAKRKKKTVFNESTCTDIEQMEREFTTIDLKLDGAAQRKGKTKTTENFFSKYICEPRHKRIKWNSLLYPAERSIHEKTLDEQAEQLMDASAERFCEWFDKLGSSSSEFHITKTQLKNLFSIESDRTLQASIKIEPQEVKAIAKAVADKWKLPEMAIELKYENYIRELMEQAPKKINTVAFGRTIPYAERPWVPAGRETIIKTVFPDELLSGRKLFEGIAHLRSVRMLIDFYRRRPHIPRPRYLVKTGKFNRMEEEQTNEEVPLYELLKLDY